jgi:hypothetical protein
MNIRYLCAGRFAGLCLLLALLSGACENPAGGNDETPAADPAATARSAADQFYATHSAILEKPAAFLTLVDEAAVNAALEAYTNLRTDVKKLLAEEKTHLDLLNVKLIGLKNAGESNIYFTAADLLAWLKEQPENTPDTPYTVAYYGDETINALYSVLEAGEKYVDLDLSGGGVRGFNAGYEEGRTFIVSLVLPDSLTEIPDGISAAAVFVDFINLKNLSAAGVTRVGNYAFRSCPSLTTVNLPNAISISNNAFMQCTSLTTVSLPMAASIGNQAFYYCTSLTTVSLPMAVSIGNQVFTYCRNLTTVSLPMAASIDNQAFYYCTGLTTVSLPKATAIGEATFQACTSLSTVSLPEAASIGNQVFQDCTSLTTITLLMAASIGNQAFFRCTSLTAVTLGTVPPSIGTTIFNGAATTPKTITIRTRYPGLYTSAGTPWTDKIGANSSVGYFWDSATATRGNLTVALTGL